METSFRERDKERAKYSTVTRTVNVNLNSKLNPQRLKHRPIVLAPVISAFSTYGATARSPPCTDKGDADGESHPSTATTATKHVSTHFDAAETKWKISLFSEDFETERKEVRFSDARAWDADADGNGNGDVVVDIPAGEEVHSPQSSISSFDTAWDDVDIGLGLGRGLAAPSPRPRQGSSSPAARM